MERCCSRGQSPQRAVAPTEEDEEEEVEINLQMLGVRRWRELVIDREKWRGIVRQAKAHSGL
jgi:hypothetical protein